MNTQTKLVSCRQISNNQAQKSLTDRGEPKELVT